MKKNKLENLILYIAAESEQDEFWGETKLYKILFAIDFIAYGYFGESVTGTKYEHLPYGPGPKKIKKHLDDMDGTKIRIKRREFFGKVQNRIHALTGADMSIFSPNEIQLIDEIIKQLKPKTATELSEWTHKLNPWLESTPNEEIPYYTVFAWKDIPVPQEGIIWAREELKRLKLK